ncbi:MAG: transposase [Planctomycetes bacterium]|nr:transposase [Planctomycetota bacterium]MBL7043823.1 transposase [Pirellulaceae bacterium]
MPGRSSTRPRNKPAALFPIHGAKRNFQILPPLDFLAEFTQHIPPKGAHLIRYYGYYSNKSRGMRGEGGSGTGRTIRQAIQRRRRLRCRTDAVHEDLGHADQARVRSGPVIVSSMWLRNEGYCVYRPASGRGDREDPARAPERSDGRRPLARVGTEAATGRGGFGPRPGWLLFGQPDGIFRTGGRTHVCGHGHLPGHLLISG